jgi:D-glycero-D-manno-heptose 1,7-bisphosphate phosphatase
MVQVAGRPFVDHLVELFREQGFRDIVFLLGYRADIMAEYLDSRDWGVRVRHHTTAPELQTLKRFRAAGPLLDDTVMVAYCDNYVPLDFAQMWQQFRASGAAVQVTCYGNEDNFTRSNMLVDTDGLVRRYDPSRKEFGLNRVDIGFALVDRDAVGPLPKVDQQFEHAVYPDLVRAGRLHAHVTHHRYYGIGDASRLPAAERFFARRPAVILDRDGVLNRRAPKGCYITDPAGLEWLDGSLQAVRMFTEAGYTIVVATNQPGIARGVMSAAQLNAVHARLNADVAAAGGRIDRIHACLDGWDDGCGCRKPATGLLFAAQRNFDLDLSRTVMVGDDERDERAARAAGCGYRQVGAGRDLLDVARELTGMQQYAR